MPLLRLAGRRSVAGSSPRVRSQRKASSPSVTGFPAFLEAKLITARFYAEVIVPPALASSGPSRPLPYGVLPDRGRSSEALIELPATSAGLRPAL